MGPPAHDGFQVAAARAVDQQQTHLEMQRANVRRGFGRHEMLEPALQREFGSFVAQREPRSREGTQRPRMPEVLPHG